MTQYIPKAAVVAEIERRKHKLLDNIMFERDKEWVVRTAHQLNRIILFLDDLEVKEVDLKKEYRDYINCDNGHTMFEIAVHFFELGIRFNNPITAADRGMAEEIIINLKRVEQDYRINLTNEMEWLRNQVKKGEEI